VTTVIHLAISRDNLITSNMRLHWAEKARKTRVIREMAHVMCKHPKRPHLPAATCDVVVKWPDRRRRDAESIAPTAKAAIDGCVDAELLTDDSDRYLKKVSYSNSDETHNTPGVACYVTLTFTPTGDW
jgi:crossover junction endodeoxyribonuclease RusA